MESILYERCLNTRTSRDILWGIAVYSARIWIWLILEGMGYGGEVPMSRRSIPGHTASQYVELRVYRSFPGKWGYFWKVGIFLG